MNRKFSQFFSSLVWLFDMLVLTASFETAFYLRFHSSTPVREPSTEKTLLTYLTCLAVFSLVFRWSGLYSSQRLTSRVNETFRIFRATVLSMLVIVSLTYFLRDERYSRLTIALFGCVSFILLSTTRTIARKLLALLRRRGHNVRNALVVGSGELALAVAERLDRRREYGIHVAGMLSQHDYAVGQKVGDFPVLGQYEDISAIIDNERIDQVYIALPLEQQPRIREVLAALAITPVDVKVVPDLYQYMTLHGGVEAIDGLPVVSLRDGPIHGWDAVAKRLFDLVFGTLILLLAAPVMLVVAALVKLTSPGPVFYAQERMGLGGRTFKILKFRSMRTDAEVKGAKWATAGDDRTTPIGKFIRKYSLDELPQFLNVLKGEMSLVGPRPERPVFIEQFKTQIPDYHLRHKVAAGITGLAQVEGWRGSTSLEKRIERDIYYVEHWSLWLDFKILVRTAFGGFLSKNAY